MAARSQARPGWPSGWLERSNPGQKAAEAGDQLRDRREGFGPLSRQGFRKGCGLKEVRVKGLDLGEKTRVESGD